MRSEERREEWIAKQLPLLRDELERRLPTILIGLTSDRVVYPERHTCPRGTVDQPRSGILPKR